MLKTENYCISAENVMAHEIIGLNAEIFESVDQNKKGIKGKIVNETKSTFEIETKKGVKKIPKKEVILKIDLKGEKVKIDGKLLTEKPEDRTKHFWRKYYGKVY